MKEPADQRVARVTPGPSDAATVALARAAMHTRFELLLHGADPVALRAAGEQALDEIERLEAQISLYRPTSEIAQVNRRASERPVPVSPNVFRVLERAAELSRATGGAFDPTIAPLVRCWGFMGGEGRRPDTDAIAVARGQVGIEGVELDSAKFTVRFRRPGMMLDLGAIGKGCAIDAAVDLLREAGIESAFIHGGTSSSFGLGFPPDAPAWKAAIPEPPDSTPPGTACVRRGVPPSDHSPNLLGEVALTDLSLGVSGIWSKSFREGDRTFGHVIDPRLGEPVHRACLAAVVLPCAAETDALSTALLVLGVEGLDVISRIRPNARFLVAEKAMG